MADDGPAGLDGVRVVPLPAHVDVSNAMSVHAALEAELRAGVTDLAGEEGVPDAELACCLLAAPSRLDNRCTVGSGGSGRPWIRGQSFKLTGCSCR